MRKQALASLTALMVDCPDLEFMQRLGNALEEGKERMVGAGMVGGVNVEGLEEREKGRGGR